MIRVIDPDRNRRDREIYLKRGFGPAAESDLYPKEKGLKPAKINTNCTINVEHFMSNLATGVCRTCSNKDDMNQKLMLAAMLKKQEEDGEPEDEPM